MVANLYNAYLPNMVRSPQRGNGHRGNRVGQAAGEAPGSESVDDFDGRRKQPGVENQAALEREPAQTPAPLTGGVRYQQPASQPASQSARNLATVADQSRQNRIQLGSILQDFESTMDALGTDEPVRSEVNAYLGVVALQAGKPSPSVPFIRQSLKTAADSLDGYIAGALGQPSRVVRDWVEALLLQNIEYRTPAKAQGGITSAGSLSSGAAPVAPTNETNGANGSGDATATKDGEASNSPAPMAMFETASAQKPSVKSLIEAGRHALQAGTPAVAVETLQTALAALPQEGSPEVAGQVYGMLGRAYQQANQPQGAVAAFQAAAQQFERAGVVQQQHKALAAMADSLNEVGIEAMQRQALQEAEAAWKQSASVLGGLSGQERMASDVWSNLGALYRSQRQYPAAARAYKQSVALAQTAGDNGAYAQSLATLADLYIEGGKPEKARALFGLS